MAVDIYIVVTSENNDCVSWYLTFTGACCLHLQFRTNRDNLNTNLSSVLFKLSHEAEFSLRIYRIYSRNSRTFLTKILYLNLGCVIYARKRFYVNKSGYTGNFLNIVLKA